MINLSIFHESNQAGEELLNLVREKYDYTRWREVNIEGKSVLNIIIKNDEYDWLRTINTSQSLQSCMNKDNIYKILEINNITFENSNEEMLIKSFEILIFDMSVISVKFTNLSNPKNPSKYIKESECTRIAELGRKAVYLLGLDYARITIAVTGKRKLKLMDIDTAPLLREKDLNNLLLKLNSIHRDSRKSEHNEVILGADPEFMMFNTKSGKIMAASEFFPYKGVVGCDNIRMPNRQQRPVAEIRPDPDISPRQLMVNIKQALVMASRMAPYRNIKWMAGSQPSSSYSIGGHIHFSNINLNYGILRALDNYVGIPVFLIENPVSAARRRRKYGRLADYRVKDHGGFEYRTPGSWLVSPDITMAVLCLAKIVASHYLELNKNYLNNIEAQTAFYAGDQDYFKLIFNDLWLNICRTEMYDQFARELKIIPDMVDQGTKWDEKIDLRQAWNITVKSKKTPGNKVISGSIQRIQQSTSSNATANRGGNNSHFGRTVIPRPVRNTRIAH